MESFSTFLEKRERNPLRKRELEELGIINNKEWVEQEIQKLSPDEKKQLKNLSRRKNITPDEIELFKRHLTLQKKQELEPVYLKGKKRDSLKLIKKYRNVKIYADQYVQNLKSSKTHMFRTLWLMLSRYKDVLPRRGFDLIITNSNINPTSPKINKISTNSVNSGGYYTDNQIFIDEEHVRDVDILIHEYAHLLADRVGRQVRPIIKKAYEGMINSYIFEITGRKSRRRKMEKKEDLKLRREIVNKIGIDDPSELGYAATNFDEWFAVLIENWKYMPNNIHTYKFKTILKKVLNRL